MRIRSKSRGVYAAIGVAAAILGGWGAARAPAADCTRTSTGLIALNDLGTGLYLGQFQGGLYPDGLNVSPGDHDARARLSALGIKPLNTAGAPDPNGKFVLLSIGMSNTTQEFCGGSFPTCAALSFVGRARAHGDVNAQTLAIVDGAAGGQTGATWDAPNKPNYDRVRDQRLAPAGLTEAQVRAVWVKVADPQPTVSLPNANANAYQLLREMGGIARAVKVRYPNVRLMFVSSRIYAGYASTTLNPEPYAYESGFACKWLVRAQIRQLRHGDVDPHAGDLGPDAAPTIVWGPYLWADGLVPRSDGLTWLCSDFASDGTHPSPGGGVPKVGALLMQFFLSSKYAAPWFLGEPPCPADFSGDGQVDFFDYLDFIGAYSAGHEAADFNADGQVDFFDYLDFIAAFAAGCE